MLLGLISGTAYLIWVRNGGAGFWGVTQLTLGIVGTLVSLVSMGVVSLMTKAPDVATQKMVDEVRIPAGKTELGKQHYIINFKGLNNLTIKIFFSNSIILI